MDWNIHYAVKDWVSLEHIQLSHLVRSLPWIHPKHHPIAAKSHPLIGPTLEIFRNTFKANNPSPWLGPLTPLRNNPDFPPETEQNFLATIWPHKDILTKHFFKRGSLLSRDELNKEINPHTITKWNYMQIKHFLTRRESAQSWTRTPTTQEELCSKITPQRHISSPPYTTLYLRVNQTSPIRHVKYGNRILT